MVAALIALALGVSPSVELTVTVWPHGRSGGSKVWTLRCDPPGGTLPLRATACRRLRGETRNPFASTPAGTVCTMIYGGPQEARVVGRFRGRPIRTTFNRRNGCEIRRWNRLSFLFPGRL